MAVRKVNITYTDKETKERIARLARETRRTQAAVIAMAIEMLEKSISQQPAK